MRLNEQEIQDCCGYIIDELSKMAFGSDYKEKNLHFDLRRSPASIRTIVEFTFSWLRLKAREKKC